MKLRLARGAPAARHTAGVGRGVMNAAAAPEARAATATLRLLAITGIFVILIFGLMIPGRRRAAAQLGNKLSSTGKSRAG